MKNCFGKLSFAFNREFISEIGLINHAILLLFGIVSSDGGGDKDSAATEVDEEDKEEEVEEEGERSSRRSSGLQVRQRYAKLTP